MDEGDSVFKSILAKAGPMCLGGLVSKTFDMNYTDKLRFDTIMSRHFLQLREYCMLSTTVVFMMMRLLRFDEYCDVGSYPSQSSF